MPQSVNEQTVDADPLIPIHVYVYLNGADGARGAHEAHSTHRHSGMGVATTTTMVGLSGPTANFMA